MNLNLCNLKYCKQLSDLKKFVQQIKFPKRSKKSTSVIIGSLKEDFQK